MPVANLKAKTFGLVLFAVTAVAMFSVFFVKAGVQLPFAGDPYQVRVTVPNAATLVKNADVREAGMIVGRVVSVEPTHEGTATLRVALDDKYAPLSSDARLRVRQKTVLGESYLAIDPGTARAGTIPDGGWASSANVDDQVQLDEILNAFDRTTRGKLRDDLLRLGGGLDGRGADLNQAFTGLEATAVEGAPITRALAAQRQELRRVIENTSGLFETLAQRRTALQRVVREVNDTARAVASRDEALAATVRRLPSTLRSVRAAATDLGAFGRAATPVLGDLTDGVAALAPAVADLTPAARSTRSLLQRLPKLVRRADPLLTQLRGFSAAAPQLTAALPGLLCEANPALDYLAPYAKDAGAFMGNVAMVTDASDEIGRNPITVIPTVDLTTLRVKDSLAAKTAAKFVDLLGLPVYHPLRYNPYPRPGTVDKPEPWDGKVPRVPSTCKG